MASQPTTRQTFFEAKAAFLRKAQSATATAGCIDNVDEMDQELVSNGLQFVHDLLLMKFIFTSVNFWN